MPGGDMQLLLEGRVMPSFDPARSTTNDVVRQAIIPLSRDVSCGQGGHALASIWNHGKAGEACALPFF